MWLDLRSLWERKKQQRYFYIPGLVLAEDPDFPRFRDTPYHIFRVGFQTVGQPWNLLFQPSARAQEAEEAGRPPTYALDLFRLSLPVAQGQPWFIYRTTVQLLEEGIPAKPVDYWSAYLPFRQIPAPPPPPGTTIECHPLGFSMIRLGGGGFN